MMIAALTDRIEVRRNCEIEIHFRTTAEQFLGQKTLARA